MYWNSFDYFTICSAVFLDRHYVLEIEKTEFKHTDVA